MSAAVSANSIIIENAFIRKAFTLKGKRKASSEIENKLCKRVLTAAKGSEEFVLSFGDGLLKKKIGASQLKIR